MVFFCATSDTEMQAEPNQLQTLQIRKQFYKPAIKLFVLLLYFCLHVKNWTCLMWRQEQAQICQRNFMQTDTHKLTEE